MLVNRCCRRFHPKTNILAALMSLVYFLVVPCSIAFRSRIPRLKYQRLCQTLASHLVTIDGPVEAVTIVKNSKFIARAFPAKNIEAALSFYERVKEAKASHNCWAYRTSRTGPTNGHWRDADWLLCRDGKWRPVEPGTFPLAHGAPSRVGRLRAYGNAINAQAAQVFVECYMESQSC